MAYRDDRATCPACATALEAAGTRMTCSKCRGVLVPAAELDDMLHSMSPDDARGLDERLTAGTEAPRPCPRCAVPMDAVVLERVPVDRCQAHGIWFDGKELERVLERDGVHFADRQWDPRRLDEAGYSVIGTPTVWTLFYRWLTRVKRPKD